MANETLPARVDLQEVQSLAQLMIQSKMFSDIQGVAQGAVRILAGRELGIGPVASLRSIEIVRGNLSIRSHLMAAMIKRSSRYNYRVTVSSDEKCTIEFLENGEACGTSEFTLDDAKRANLTGNDSWKRYPKTMLYNRAMSQGARMYCPDIFLGGVFYENEIIEAETPVNVNMTDTEREPLEFTLDGGRDSAALEAMTDKQRRTIFGLMKRHGIHDGDKQKLIDFAHPNGISKTLASKFIEHVNTQKTLPDHIRRSYVNMLVQSHGHDRYEVAAHMDKSYGHHDPTKLNNAQFVILVEHLAGDDIPEPKDNDIYTPESEQKEVTAQDWVEFTKDICTSCEITYEQFAKWALSLHGNGTITQINNLPKEVYYSLTAMDTDSIKSAVLEFHTIDTEQGMLVS